MAAQPPPAIQIVKNGAINASGTAVTEPLFVGNYWKKTIHVKTSGSVKVYARSCPSGDIEDLYFVKSGYTSSAGGSADDAAYEHATAGEADCFDVDIHMAYVVLVIDNQAASAIDDLQIWLTGVGI
jgi:hypothetical protein